MSSNIIRILRRTTLVGAFITLLSLPLTALAAVEVGPGDTANNLAADGGNILEECATTASETCTVAINAALNEVGALVDAQATGAGAAAGDVFTDFSVSGDSGAVLLGSFVSAQVDVAGLLEALASDAMASVDVSLKVMDMTAGVLVGAQTVVDQTIVNGSLPVSKSNAVVIPVALTRGHDYRVSLVVAAEAAGGVSDGAQSDFFNTASWSGLAVTAGQDPFGAIGELADRVSDVESDVSRLIPVVRMLVADLDALEALVDRIANALRDLQQTVAELREDFDNHTHTYLTGKGKGHNNTEATTTVPANGETPVPVPVVDGPGNSENANENANANANENANANPQQTEKCGKRDARRGLCTRN